MNNDDSIRSAVFQYFFDLYQKNPLAWRAGSSVVKALSDLPKNHVYAAVEFLADEKYLKTEKRQVGRERYKISTKGLQEFSPSRFKTSPLSPLSINSRGGIFVFGDNLGKIQQETVVSFEEVNQLIRVINKSDLSDERKRNLIGDAETIKVQLTKPKPNHVILQKAWDTIQQASSISEAIQLIQTIGQVIGPYIK